MANFGRFQNITSENETDFSHCADKYSHMESENHNSLHIG